MNRTSARRGFTLIELLLVIGIIAILASIVIVAVNPNKQLGDARNSQRRADVNAILNAVYQYYIDNGSFPSNNGAQGVAIPDVSTTGAGTCNATDGTNKFNCFKEICALNTGTANCDSTNVVMYGITGSYIVSMPKDPKVGAESTAKNLTVGYNGNDTAAHKRYGSLYFIGKTATNRITVFASGTEMNGSIVGTYNTSSLITVSR